MTVISFNAGELNRRLVLEAPVEVDDGAGGVSVVYETAATVWASLKPLSARGNVAADNLGGLITHQIVIRAGREVMTRHRFRDGTRIFRVVAVRDSTNRRFLEISAEERQD